MSTEKRIIDSLPAHPEGPQTSPTATAPQSQTTADSGHHIPLKDPITVNGQPLDRLTLRAPTFGDWLDCGELQETLLHNVDPANFQNAGGQTVEIRNSPKATMAWATRLSGLRAPDLRKLSLRDFRRLQQALQKLVGELEAGN